MPQIAQLAATYASQFFWLAIVFGLIYFGIGRSMLPKIEATVDARDRRIADDLAAAQQARTTADATEDAYRLRMNDARVEAARATQAAKAESAAATAARTRAADVDLAIRAEEAEARLDVARTQALAGIEDVAAEAAQDIVARISGITVDRAEATSAVRTAIAAA